MPSVPPWRDLLTWYVAMQGAAGVVMRRCLFRGSIEDSYPPTANGYAGFLVNSMRVSAKSRYDRVNPFRILLMSILPHGKQISPDKNVSFSCTTACLCVSARRQAAFTLPPEPAGFVVLCQLAQRLTLVCGFCPPNQVRGRLWLARMRSGFSMRVFARVATTFGPLLAETPRFSGSSTCFCLVLLVVSIYDEHFLVLVQGTSCLCVARRQVTP